MVPIHTFEYRQIHYLLFYSLEANYVNKMEEELKQIKKKLQFPTIDFWPKSGVFQALICILHLIVYLFILCLSSV